ncbi:hypothetical protein K438DRAFT_1947366 [Mycena galopus ATCC 62051]|nr:hypothetical protein K438DRAFT_1947366 [Mycena galopus ATCC 62051]
MFLTLPWFSLLHKSPYRRRWWARQLTDANQKSPFMRLRDPRSIEPNEGHLQPATRVYCGIERHMRVSHLLFPYPNPLFHENAQVARGNSTVTFIILAPSKPSIGRPSKHLRDAATEIHNLIGARLSESVVAVTPKQRRRAVTGVIELNGRTVMLSNSWSYCTARRECHPRVTHAPETRFAMAEVAHVACEGHKDSYTSYQCARGLFDVVLGAASATSHSSLKRSKRAKEVGSDERRSWEVVEVVQSRKSTNGAQAAAQLWLSRKLPKPAVYKWLGSALGGDGSEAIKSQAELAVAEPRQHYPRPTLPHGRVPTRICFFVLHAQTALITSFPDTKTSGEVRMLSGKKANTEGKPSSYSFLHVLPSSVQPSTVGRPSRPPSRPVKRDEEASATVPSTDGPLDGRLWHRPSAGTDGDDP